MYSYENLIGEVKVRIGVVIVVSLPQNLYCPKYAVYGNDSLPQSPPEVFDEPPFNYGLSEASVEHVEGEVLCSVGPEVENNTLGFSLIIYSFV